MSVASSPVDWMHLDKMPEVAQIVMSFLESKWAREWRAEDRSWRDEDRKWREEDVAYREEERGFRQQEMEMQNFEKRWRGEDVEQRHLENARYLWSRFVEKNRRDVEEKSEQLKAISNLSALFAGFAVVTLTQFQFNPKEVSYLWIASYGMMTAIVVGLNTLSMVTCTLILGSILKNGKSYVSEEAEEDFMADCLHFAHRYDETSDLLPQRPPAPPKTFETFWEHRCEDDWRRAFNMFSCGVSAFLMSLITIGWIKFNYSPGIASLFITIVIISLACWCYTMWSWGCYLTASEKSVSHTESAAPVDDLIRSGLPFAWHVRPRCTDRSTRSR